MNYFFWLAFVGHAANGTLLVGSLPCLALLCLALHSIRVFFVGARSDDAARELARQQGGGEDGSVCPSDLLSASSFEQ
jgi:hypothetical protein